MAFHVERLEKSLHAWEDFWFIINCINRVLAASGVKNRWCANEPALQHSHSFRKQLLNAHNQHDHPLNLANFLPANQKEWPIAQGHSLPCLPNYLAPWCICSRRVYSITEELQAVLDATSLDGVTWNDVSFPFYAFAVSLGKPILREDGRRYDFIMVNAVPELQVYQFAFFSDKFDAYVPLTQTHRENIQNKMRKKQWDKVAKTCDHLLARVGTVAYTDLSLVDQPNMDVLETAETVYDVSTANGINLGPKARTLHVWNSMLRIVVGMCLYLRTLPPKTPHQSDWRPTPRSGLPDPRAISNGSEVCTVSSCYALTTEEKVVLGLEDTAQEKAQYELSCHFRAGHWRRPPGMGRDPTAKKTIHVRPCIVRKDRLRDGELPGGSQTII